MTSNEKITRKIAYYESQIEHLTEELNKATEKYKQTINNSTAFEIVEFNNSRLHELQNLINRIREVYNEIDLLKSLIDD